MTYDDAKGFDLALKYDELIDGDGENKKGLVDASFDTIPHATVLQALAAITTGSIRAKDILKIRKEAFIKNWEPMVSSMFLAVDFIRTKFRVPVSQLLPYSSLLIPFTYFFFKNKNKKPSESQSKLLEQFFFWVGLNWRYSGSTETSIAEDIGKIDLILSGKKPQYPSDELRVYADDIAEQRFSTGNAYVKTILCLLAAKRPKNFDDGSDVILDNSYLKIATSKNYHHFFPKAYLNKQNKESNLVANITLIGANPNISIGAKAPSRYISNFETKPQVLKSHLIENKKTFGILNNNYEMFIEKRSSAIADALNEILNPKI